MTADSHRDPRLARRLHGIPPTIFARMSFLATATGAVNLGQGFPDVDGPSSVAERAAAALHSGRHNQYAPGIGIPELRHAIVRHQQRHYGLDLDPDRQVVVTTGCTEAIAAAILGLVDPGDEVVVLEPYYDSYVAMLQVAGAVRRPVTLRAPDFRLDVEQLRAAVTPCTRFVLLNTPHNPTGTVLTQAELQAVADLAIEHDLVVITDEVYEHLTYPDGQGDAATHRHLPIATLPGMAERTLTLSSVGKSYSFTGWKVGWATGPADLVEAVLAAKQWLTYTSGSPLQPAVAHALDEEGDYPLRLGADLRERRDLLCAGLSDLGLRVRVPEGTYFALADIGELGWPDGATFCDALPDRAGVVAIPVQGFYDDAEAGRQLVRFAFCKQPEVIEEGLRRLSAADLTA
ncbi:pyridoxal phosphate-dependent aminotransferase [Nocardioides ferulae]|uniref:pyridoxal phosphate-dependent aminotransferase n=1 Tax=Nocardioides ferulae TaxID=2340821 RepID=UPI000EAD69DC|nr:pyridoxal phosphate-dependent aminotransferase [Nocardioides ferulae]